MTSRLRGGIYNCLYGRNPRAVRRFVRAKMRTHDLGFLLLQEVSDYIEVLSTLPGYTLFCFDKGDEAVLVKNTVPATGAKTRRMTDTRYFRVNGKLAPYFHMPSVLLDDWLRVCSLHMPVSVDWTGGEAGGPALRVIAYSEYAAKLVEFDQQHRRIEPAAALLYGGDWNESPKSEGVFSPSWIAESCGMSIQRVVNEDRALGHRLIDYAMVRGGIVEAGTVAKPVAAKLRKVLRLDGGDSDHPFIVFTVVKPDPEPVCPTCGQLLP